MPIKVKQNLPAQHILEQENIFVMTEQRAMTQDIRPLNVLVLNLMPTKIVTETQLLRKLSNTPLQIQVEFLQTVTYKSQHTDSSHLDEFYKSFDEVKDHFYDGLIITGAPLDFIDYEDVDYWDEVCKIMEWSKKHVHCTFHLCWGAYAGLIIIMVLERETEYLSYQEFINIIFLRKMLHYLEDLMMYFTLHIQEQLKLQKSRFLQNLNLN